MIKILVISVLGNHPIQRPCAVCLQKKNVARKRELALVNGELVRSFLIYIKGNKGKIQRYNKKIFCSSKREPGILYMFGTLQG